MEIWDHWVKDDTVTVELVVSTGEMFCLLGYWFIFNGHERKKKNITENVGAAPL